MNITDRYQQLITQRAYARAAEARGLAALLAPYTVRPVVTIPAQRRRTIRTGVAA